MKLVVHYLLVVLIPIPPDLSFEQKLNLLTAMAVGLYAAKFVIGFGFTSWLDFGTAAAAGSVLAGSVVWL